MWRNGTADAFRLTLVMLLWAACFPLITVGLASAPHLTFAAIRAILAGAALVALGVILRRPLPSAPAAWGWIALIGLGTTTLGFLGMVHAAEFVAPGMATVIANTQPLLAAAIAYAFLGEQLGSRGYAGLALGFAGIALIAAPRFLATGQDGYYIGIAYILLATLGITLGNVIMKRVAGSMDPVMAMGLQLLLGAVPLALAALVIEEPSSVRWSTEFALVLASLALAGTALPFWLWFSVLEKTELSRANAYTFLVPLFGLAIGLAFFDEAIDAFAAAGAALAVFGTWWAQAAATSRR